MRKSTFVLGAAAGLTLAGCAEPWSDQSLERATDRGANLGESTAGQVLDRLNGEPITAENIDQAFFEVNGTLIRMVEFCRARVENTTTRTAHEMNRATYEFEAEGDRYPIVGTFVKNTGEIDAENYSAMFFDVGVEEIPAIGVVSESRWPDQLEFLTEAEFQAFVLAIFGDKPAWECITAR